MRMWPSWVDLPWTRPDAHSGAASWHWLASHLEERSPGDVRPVELPGRAAELAPLVDALNRFLDRTAQAISTERAFLSTVAHELKTPLTVIATQAHLLAAAAGEKERRQAQHALESGVQRIAHLVNQLLTLAMLEGGAQGAGIERLDLSALLRERLVLQQPAASRLGVLLSLSVPASARMSGDRNDWVSIVDNLIDNAIRYNRPGGQVDVRLDACDGVWTLRVDDSGIGIAPGERERVFERFFRSHAVSAPGNGLGLSIVRQAALRQGACVQVADPRLRDELDRPVGASLVVRTGCPAAGA